MAKRTCAVHGTSREGTRPPDTRVSNGKAFAIGVFVLLVGSPELSAQAPDGWDWSARLASNRTEFANSIAVDSVNQAVYTAGQAERGFSGILGGLWALLFGNSTGSDGYLIKQDFAGTVQWQIVIGGSGDDAITGVCVDPQGFVYITGYFTGSNASFTGVSGSDQRMNSAGGTDLFLAKYSPAGVLQWKQRAGGGGDDAGTGICHGAGQVYAAGSFMGTPSIGGLATSVSAASFANRTHGYLIALQASNGTGIWRVDGVNGENSTFNAVATDGQQVFTLGVHDGAAYTFAGTSTPANTLATLAGSGVSADVLALSSTGTIHWSQAVSNPGDDAINALGLAASDTAIYISGSTHNGSTFPGGMVINTVPASHDHGYVARLRKASGLTDWVRTFTSPDGNDHSQVGRSLATDSYGGVLLAGSYEESLLFPGATTLNGADDLQVYLAKYSSDGIQKWALTATGAGDDQANAVATNKAGKVFIAGSYRSNISFNGNFYDDNSQNLFIAQLTDLEPGILGFRDPSAFRAFGPLCANAGPTNLAIFLLPVKAGTGTSVFSSSGITSSGNDGPMGALGLTPGGVALFDDANDQLIIDLGDTIPAGEAVILRWRSTGGMASMNIQGSMSGAGVYTDHGNIGTASTAMVFTGIDALVPVRFIKLTRNTGSDCAVTGIYYNFGGATGGTWSGTGVSGNTFNPAGLSGIVGITYTAQGHSTTHTVAVDMMSEAGVLSGGGEICPGTDATMVLNGTVGASITWRLSTDGGATWSSTPTGQTSHTLNGLTVPTQVGALVTNGACPADLSNFINILPLDTTPPAIIGCSGNITAYTSISSCHASVNYTPPTATDACGTTTLTVDSPSHLPLAAFPKGITMVHWTALDVNGNSSTCQFTITVMDTVRPSITCPSAVAATTNTGCTATGVNLGTPSTSDNCAVASVTNNAPAAFAIGATTVIWTVTDASGNSATCTQMVTVSDNTPPSITCPAAIVATTTSGCTATGVNLGTPSTSDNCAVASVSNNAPTAFAIGATTVTWTVTDASGNSATCIQTVTVSDNTPPSITCPAAIVATTTSGCTATGVNLGTPTTSDNCAVASVTNNAPAAFAIGATTVTWTVTDASGNSATCPSTVTVLDVDPPEVICPDTVQVAISAGLCSVQAFIPTPQMTDNCSLAFLSDSANADGLYSGSWFPEGLHTVVYTVSDASGNTSTCTSTVMAMPPIHPSLNYPFAEVCTGAAAFQTMGPVPPDAAFSAMPAGLSIDPAIGIIHPDASAPGNYTITLTIPGPCPLDTSVQLVITGAADAGSDTSLVFCESSTDVVDLFTLLGGSPQPGGNWRHGAVQVSGLFGPALDGPGAYTYHIPANNACGPDSSVVTIAIAAASHAGQDTSFTLCSNNAVVNLMALLPGADPGGTWSNGTGLFNPANDAAGVITYSVQGHAPCPSAMASVTLTAIPAPNAGNPGSLTLCTNGGNADLFSALQGTPQEGGTWTGPDNQPMNGSFDPIWMSEGNYTYTINGISPCPSDSSTVSVAITAPPSASWNAPGPLCSSAAAIDLGPYVTGVPGGTWSGPGVNGSSFDPGAVPVETISTTIELTYTATASNCMNSASGSITLLATPVANAGPDAVACGLSYQLAATAPFGTGSWSAGGNAATFSPAAALDATVVVSTPGSYPLQWSISNGQCSDVDTVIITFHLPEELTALDAGPDQTQDLTRHTALTGTAVGATEIHWSVLAGGGYLSSPEESTTEVDGLSIGANIFRLSARVGVCPFMMDTVAITVRDLFIPSGFSPNGDGVNDLFEVIGIEVLPNNELTVFNRWGQQVYHATAYANQWDGHGADGQVLAEGTYFYVLQFNGDGTTYHGQVIIK